MNPSLSREQKPIFRSPQEICQHLSQTARESVTEVEAFKQEWRKPEMEAIWKKVDKKLAESGGVYPQPTGRWEQDYDIVLKRLGEEDKRESELRIRSEEEQERSHQASTAGGWKAIIEGFNQKNTSSEVFINILPSADNAGRFSVVLRKISVMFYVQQTPDPGNQTFGDWQVLILSRKSPTALGSEIVNQINARSRKWDLLYLLVRETCSL